MRLSHIYGIILVEHPVYRAKWSTQLPWNGRPRPNLMSDLCQLGVLGAIWCFIWSFENILEFPRVCWPTGTIVLEKPFLTGSEWVSSCQRKELYHLRMFQGGGIKAPTSAPISWCFTWRIHKVPPSGSMIPTFSVTLCRQKLNHTQLVGGLNPSEKWWTSSVGMVAFPTEWKNPLTSIKPP